MRIWRSVALIAMGPLLGACARQNPVAGELRQAAAQVAPFHRQVAAGQVADVWLGASGELRGSVGEPQLASLLGRVRQALGPAVSSERKSWGFAGTAHVEQGRLESSTADYLSLTYRTAFQCGAGTETFVYRLHDGTPKLAGYRIDSPRLSGEVSSRRAGTQMWHETAI